MSAVATTVRPTKLFIGGLSQNTTTKLLRTHFSEYGKVLDCVAMFNQDGRARSFGYVTLDSLSAAELCVSEPQVVDGRVVDVKLAVPESPAGKKAPSTRTRRAVSTTASKRAPKTTSTTPTPLSATAPAFVPMDAGLLVDDDDELPQDADDSDKSAGEEATMPLESSAEDVSLTMEVVAARLAAAGVGAPPGLAPLTGLPASRPPLPAMPPPPPPSALQAEGKVITGDDEDASTTAPSSTTVSPSVSQVQLEESETEEAGSEDVASEPLALPSAGSALHATGNCRPCNFFSKGRCTNAIDCEFCHLPHQKRKPTRQEKRERATAWMDRQKAKAEEQAAEKARALLAETAAKAAAMQEAKPAMQPMLPTMVPSALPGIMFNFDCFSDSSDSEDEDDVAPEPTSKVVAAPAVVLEEETTEEELPEEKRVWSRELMLALKATMDCQSKNENASDEEAKKLMTLR